MGFLSEFRNLGFLSLGILSLGILSAGILSAGFLSCGVFVMDSSLSKRKFSVPFKMAYVCDEV